MAVQPLVPAVGTAATQREGARQQQVRKPRLLAAGPRAWAVGMEVGSLWGGGPGGGEPDFQMQQAFLREARKLGWGLGAQRKSQCSLHPPASPKAFLLDYCPSAMLPALVAGLEIPTPFGSLSAPVPGLLLGRKVNRLWESFGPQVQRGRGFAQGPSPAEAGRLLGPQLWAAPESR